jgi:hypothetical protein
MEKSLKEKLYILTREIIICPGEEKNFEDFIKGRQFDRVDLENQNKGIFFEKITNELSQNYNGFYLNEIEIQRKIAEKNIDAIISAQYIPTKKNNRELYYGVPVKIKE